MDEKRTYIKPEWRKFGMPTAQAACSRGGDDVSVRGACLPGYHAGDPGSGYCYNGDHPKISGSCFTGNGDTGGNVCGAGEGVA